MHKHLDKSFNKGGSVFLSVVSIILLGNSDVRKRANFKESRRDKITWAHSPPFYFLFFYFFIFTFYI